jgi:sugar O-acyltransferase (sialic acid O-acetyltransferase NeuD family)
MKPGHNQLIIIGAGSVGGHIATNLHLYLKEDIEVLFFDDDETKIGQNFCGAKVVGKVNEVMSYPKDIKVVVGIAFPKIKKKIISQLIAAGYTNFPSLISENAWISHNVKIGKGVIIYPGCAVNYATQIEDFVVLNMNCAIGHDCRLGDYSSFSPGANLGGHTSIGEFSEIGIGASTVQSVKIGSNVKLGAGAVVSKSLPDNCTAIGIPAKPIKFC